MEQAGPLPHCKQAVEMGGSEKLELHLQEPFMVSHTHTHTHTHSAAVKAGS